MCVYGKCYYCKETEAVCADSEHMLEGVVLQLIPGTLSKYRSPWQRTYKENVNADWEINMQFCEYYLCYSQAAINFIDFFTL